MSVELYVTAAGILAVLVFSFLTWRAVSQQRPTATGPADNLPVEMARLQERERSLDTEISRLTTLAENSASELALLRASSAEAREKLAGADERISTLQGSLNKSNDDLTALIALRDNLQAALSETSQKLAAAQTAEKELRDRISRAEKYITDRDEKIIGLEKIIDEFRNRAAEKERDLAALRQKQAGLEQTMEEKKAELLGLQERLKTEFQNIANNVLTSATDRLTQSSGESLLNIVSPLRVRIEQFQSRIDAVHTEETSQRAALSIEIQKLAETAGNLGHEADAFAKALKGDSGMRGHWGEVRLERILQLSGLEQDREYVVQGGEFNIKNEEGRNQRPDFIILLPENRHFVIDSKLSLVDFLEYEIAETDERRSDALRKFLNSCRKHVDDLSGKDYQHGDSINSHDLVLMFMPIEGAAALALKSDPGLFEYAWRKRILIVSPGTLFLAMRTVSSIWRYERQNQNAQAIASEAGKLYDKLASFVDDLNEVSDKIRKASLAHDSAMKKLGSGRGNALGRAQKLRTMGVPTKKEFPMVLIDGEKQPIEDDDEEIPIEAARRLVAS